MCFVVQGGGRLAAIRPGSKEARGTPTLLGSDQVPNPCPPAIVQSAIQCFMYSRMFPSHPSSQIIAALLCQANLSSAGYS